MSCEPKSLFLPLFLLIYSDLLFLPLPSAQDKSLLLVRLYSQMLPRVMPGKHRDNRTRRKLESQREGVTGKESSLFGWSSDQIRLFSDSGMLVYETGKLPPSVDGWGLSDRADYLYFTTRTHVCMHAYHTVYTHIARKDILYPYTHTHILYKQHSHCNSMAQIASGRYTSDKLCMAKWTRVRMTVSRQRGVLESLRMPISPPGL